MATTAFRGEVGLAGAGVAHEDRGSRLTDGWGLALRSNSPHFASNKRGHCFRVRRTHRYRGHTGVLSAALDDGNKQFTVLIAEGQLRSQQIGTTQIAASKIRAVATGAGDS